MPTRWRSPVRYCCGSDMYDILLQVSLSHRYHPIRSFHEHAHTQPVTVSPKDWVLPTPWSARAVLNW